MKLKRLRPVGCLAAVVLTVTTAAACSPRFEPARAPGPPLLSPSPIGIERVSLRYSNVFLLRSGDATALVDAGSPSDGERITAALAERKLRPNDIKLVVLTHGHGDHAGLGSFFQKAGAKVVVGRGDEMQTTVGQNDEMTPTSMFARVLKPFVRLDYEPFRPDLLVEEELLLDAFGFRGVRVRHMPGHTRGSLVLLIGSPAREAIVGDQMLGGVWGGMFHEASAGEHYYQLNLEQNHANVRRLLDEGVETFHLGHGGPVRRDAVLQWLLWLR